MDMRFEFEEDDLYSRIREVSQYKMNAGDFMKVADISDLPPEKQLEQFLEEEKDFDYSSYDEP